MKLGIDVILPLNWKALNDGKVHCVLSPEFVAGTKCWFNEFDFVYRPTENEIELIVPRDAQSCERQLPAPCEWRTAWRKQMPLRIRSSNRRKKISNYRLHFTKKKCIIHSRNRGCCGHPIVPTVST
jgi:hypothetical protein